MNCRVCNGNLFATPLLKLENMPKAAQFLPTKDELATEKGVDLNVMQCSGCGLVQLDCEPVPYYKEVIRASGVSQEMREFRLKQFTDFAERFGLKGKTILEIGCGKGEYLELMRDMGMDACGLEESEESFIICHKDKLLNVKWRYLDNDITLKKDSFDAFAILSFLEHMPDPCSMFQYLLPSLKEDAVGLVEVPNFDMMLRERQFSEFIPDHLMYFTKDTLTTTLNINGFDVIECNEIWHGYILSAVVQKRAALDLSDFNTKRRQMSDSINKFISKHPVKSVAVWGAGHQSLAMISLSGIGNRIKYVIDSAPFKQGKYTPATHVEIISPSAIASDKPSAIIVMCAGYSDEVAKTIKQQHPDMPIAILRESKLEIVGE